MQEAQGVGRSADVLGRGGCFPRYLAEEALTLNQHLSGAHVVAQFPGSIKGREHDFTTQGIPVSVRLCSKGEGSMQMGSRPRNLRPWHEELNWCGRSWQVSVLQCWKLT